MALDRCGFRKSCPDCLKTSGCWFMRRSAIQYGECIPEHSATGNYFLWLTDGEVDLPDCPPVPSADPNTQIGAFSAFADSSADGYWLLLGMLVLLVFVFFLVFCFLYFCVWQCLFGKASRRGREASRQRRREPHVPNFLPDDEIRLEHIQVINESSEEEIITRRESPVRPAEDRQQREASVLTETRYRRSRRTTREPVRFPNVEPAFHMQQQQQ